jgi:hypothetical protein
MADARTTTRTTDPVLHEALDATVGALAAIDRAPCSPGEREAAEWIARRREELGCRVAIDEERSYDNFARPIGRLAALGAASGLLAQTRLGRRAGALGGAIAAAAIAEDVSNGPRLFRRATMRQQPTWNVVADAGDDDAPATLVILAHHDAAPTGRIFDQTLQHAWADIAPGIIERIDTSIPLWWPVVGGPALIAYGAARRRRGLVRFGTLAAGVAAAAFADIASSPTVPGANDNLSAVAVLVALAERLRDEPVEGLRVMLVSCGSEEVLQGGIHGFVEHRLRKLDPKSTFVLNLDTVGSPELILLEGEGTMVMEDYHLRSFRDRVAEAAARARIPLRRGMRARSSTDAVIPSRAGYPTATIASMDRAKALSNYHQMSDVPENLVYRTVAQALAICEALARELAEDAGELIGA